MIPLYVFTYLCILAFLFLVVRKLVKYSRMPVHLRWELYPVAHEAGRSKYGGSRFEEPDWWEKKDRKSHIGELMAMSEEIFLLKGVYENNRKFWFLSYPFHLGLYLITGTFFLILTSAVLNIFSAISLVHPVTFLGGLFFYVTNICGFVGLVLTFIGCVALIVRRTTDEKYKVYNTPLDFINLGFVLVVDLSIILTLAASNPSFILSKVYMRDLITFNFAPVPDTYFVIQVILISLFLLYFPLTRMTHLFAKYFTYHKVRWEDEPNFRGGKLESRIREALNFGVSWSAPHMKTGKTWAEVATNLPTEVKK